MTFRAPVTKPYGVAPSPYMAQGAGKGLWRRLAFIAPFQTPKGAGISTLLDQFGHPLAGSNLTAGSTLQWRNTPYGLGVGISGASNLLTQADYLPLLTSNGVGTGDFTVVFLANPPAEAAITDAVSQSVSGVQPRFEMFLNTNASIVATSGSFCVYTRDATNVAAAVAGVIDGRYHLFGGSRDGNNLRAWVDGIQRSTTTNTAQNIAGAGGGFAIGSRSESGSNNKINTATNMVFVAGWNRALSNFEMLLLGIDPFYMFRPYESQRVIDTVAAGGATAVPVFMHHYMQQRAA